MPFASQQNGCESRDRRKSWRLLPVNASRPMGQPLSPSHPSRRHGCWQSSRCSERCYPPHTTRPRLARAPPPWRHRKSPPRTYDALSGCWPLASHGPHAPSGRPTAIHPWPLMPSIWWAPSSSTSCETQLTPSSASSATCDAIRAADSARAPSCSWYGPPHALAISTLAAINGEIVNIPAGVVGQR